MRAKYLTLSGLFSPGMPIFSRGLHLVCLQCSIKQCVLLPSHCFILVPVDDVEPFLPRITSRELVQGIVGPHGHRALVASVQERKPRRRIHEVASFLAHQGSVSDFTRPHGFVPKTFNDDPSRSSRIGLMGEKLLDPPVRSPHLNAASGVEVVVVQTQVAVVALQGLL